MFLVAAVLVPGFSVHGILAAILGPVVLSFVNTLVTNYLEKNPKYLAAEKSSELKTEV